MNCLPSLNQGLSHSATAKKWTECKRSPTSCYPFTEASLARSSGLWKRGHHDRGRSLSLRKRFVLSMALKVLTKLLGKACQAPPRLYKGRPSQTSRSSARPCFPSSISIKLAWIIRSSSPWLSSIQGRARFHLRSEAPSLTTGAMR